MNEIADWLDDFVAALVNDNFEISQQQNLDNFFEFLALDIVLVIGEHAHFNVELRGKRQRRVEPRIIIIAD